MARLCKMTHALITVAFLVTLASAIDNQSTCGAKPTPKDCDHVDFGSCGNACCVIDASFEGVNASHVYNTLSGYLRKGGDDGSFAYVTGPDKAGHNPGDSLVPYNISWAYVFQGSHTTSGGYVDTLNFNLKDASGITTLRMFSVSNIHSALGDAGQNYKSLAYMLEGRGLSIVYGCGKGVVPPLQATAPPAALGATEWPRWLRGE